MTITPANYFKSVQHVDWSAVPASLKKSHELLIPDAAHNNWAEFHQDAEVRRVIEKYFGYISKYVPASKETPKEAPKKAATNQPKQKEGASEDMKAQARVLALGLIRHYVLRGDPLEELRKSCMGSSNNAGSAHIRRNKIEVGRVGDVKVNFSFSLPTLFNEIKAVSSAAPPEAEKVTKSPKYKAAPKQIPSKLVYATKEVAHIDSDVAFIKRYAAMHGKVKSSVEILRLLKGLQKAMLEGRIGKDSPYAHVIHDMQESLTDCYEKMHGSGNVSLTIPDFKLKQYIEIAHSETKSLSVTLLTAYIRLHGATGMRAAAKKLHAKIYQSVQSGKIKEDDRYIKQLDRAYANLDQFLHERHPALNLHQAELNGLSGITGVIGTKKKAHEPLAGFSKVDLLEARLSGRDLPEGSLNGIDTIPSVHPEQDGNTGIQVMNSMDFVNLRFDTLGFKGKWLAFIGDPSVRFSMMVFGKPKLGKSFLCLDFAGYLAQHHGRVLYVAKEEGLDKTFQDKLSETRQFHQNMSVANGVPPDLNGYQFVFLDSVNTLNLRPADLKTLQAKYPRTSFIYVFQSTKDGNFRGANSFQHDVDIVVEVPEKGKAVQFGRFNQGGKMDIAFPPDKSTA